MLKYDLTMGTFNLAIDGIWYEDLPFKMTEGTDRTLSATININETTRINSFFQLSEHGQFFNLYTNIKYIIRHTMLYKDIK